ncbi:MAG: hypothetical protein NZ519_01460 [Bacteroidia bacterium]|nr:hypothetical protein [Bacteroidia bacterium]MDW8301408.1 hypothetical protein [Bacteroidia bacterium]
MKPSILIAVLLGIYLNISTVFAGSIATNNKPIEDLTKKFALDKVEQQKITKISTAAKPIEVLYKKVFKKTLETSDFRVFNLISAGLAFASLFLFWIPIFGMLIAAGAVVLGILGQKYRLRGIGLAGAIVGGIMFFVGILFTLLIIGS